MIVEFKIKNFRAYEKECVIDFEDLTAFVGKNDVGKSSVLEALDIFFNSGKGPIKLEKDDLNVKCSKQGDDETILSACFSDLPREVTLDDSYSTSLSEEFMLNNEDQLEIVKKYKAAGKEKVYIKANHPTNPNCADLLTKKNSELKKIIEKDGISCENRSINSIMRKAIWDNYSSDLHRVECEIDITKGEDGGIKSIWEKLQNYIPIYTLFKSDRKNSDTDDEVQDPLKTAVEQILKTKEVSKDLEAISKQVKEKLKEVADKTLLKLKAINSDLAESLSPRIPDALDWRKVFSGVSIISNDEIPINKRGSGVKRLVLLSFFQAEAEKKQDTSERGIIYAIEEPETSQHYEHQKLLIKALIELAQKNNTQVILTTHSSLIVKNLDFDSIRLILNDKISKNNEIKHIEQKFLPYVSLNEVNYVAFGEISEEYHNELFGFLQSKAIDENPDNSYEAPFDNWLTAAGCEKRKTWIRINREQNEIPCNYTLCTYIRNKIHHPENPKNVNYTSEELKQSIEIMQSICRNIQ